MKNCCPTKVGGQAILEGLMMRGNRALAIAVRKPDGNIHLAVEPLPGKSKWAKIPVVRGVYAFVSSLVTGTGVLFYGADLLEKWEEEKETREHPEAAAASKESGTDEKKKDGGLSQGAIYLSVVLALAICIGLFVLFPTFVLSLVKKAGVESVLLLNLLEGVLRILLFVGYVAACSLMPDIKRTFEYHGAEHKTIHCYENGLDLTPENAQTFYTLHPRCGTSFMVFVMVISLLIFSLFGWPNLWLRVLSRLLLIPVVAGLSYELLQFTGRHNNGFVKAVSIPGIMLQKVTTREPSLDQLEVAIAAMKAVLPSHENPDIPVDYWVGVQLPDGTLVKDEAATSEYIESKKKK